MKLTKAHIAAGAIRLNSLEPNSSGSWTVVCDLNLINRESNGTNYRKFSKVHVNKISKSYNPLALRNPILMWNSELKKLDSIDGKHSTEVMLNHGIQIAPCDIHFNITKKQGSDIFYELTQNSKRMAVWDAYAAALGAGRQFAIDIQSALRSFGFSNPKDSGFNQAKADFSGFSPLKDAIDLGFNFLVDFLKIMCIWKATGKKLENVARSVCFQRGLLDFLEHYRRHYQFKDIISSFKRYSATQIMEVAETFDHCERVDRSQFKLAFEFIMNTPRMSPRPHRSTKSTSSKLVKA